MADEIDVDVRKVRDALDDFTEAFKTTIKVESGVEILWPTQFHHTLRDQSLRPLPVKGVHVVLPQQRRVDVVTVGMVVGEYRVGCGHNRFGLSKNVRMGFCIDHYQNVPAYLISYIISGIVQ